jgi:hypothetical protein
VAAASLPADSASWRQLGTAQGGAEFLYRFYDADMRLLYVGVTWNPFDRWTFHRRTKPWWESVRSFDLFICASDREAREYETAMIRTLHPIHNKMQNLAWHRAPRILEGVYS